MLFLEQCAQVFNRKVKLGEYTLSKEEEDAMDLINETQINYIKPKRDTGALFDNSFSIDLNNPPKTIQEFLDSATSDFDRTYAYPAVGGYLIAQNRRDWQQTFKPGIFDAFSG